MSFLSFCLFSFSLFFFFSLSIFSPASPEQGRDVVARVQIANLSDDFLKDFKAHFHVGQRVTGRIMDINPNTKRLEMSLKPVTSK